MNNLLLEEVRYRVTETAGGTWRRYMYPTGAAYAEYTSRRRLFGLPLVHHTRGICPETGSRTVARGVLAVGNSAVGVVAIGRFALGIVALGQLSAGVLGIGQVTFGPLALGQLAVGVLAGAGQFATGVVAIGQLGVGKWVLAQLGVGEHVWSMGVKDPAAIEFFRALPGRLGLGA